MDERQYVYDAKVIIRCMLHILQTIKTKLSWKGDHREIFSRTVFGKGLDLRTTSDDNHLLNFLLQHQRYVDNSSTSSPFMFDIEEDKSSFHLSVFPMIGNIKGERLFELVKNDREFNELEDEDVVCVCLLLALDYVFMGQELKHDNKVTEEQEDVGVSNLMDVDQPYLGNNVFDDVHVEDADQTKVNIVVVPFE
uniref:Phospholipase-like protein n=1 Tax=Tanacetum cinerariifolium TaxID=118510 RepID=A0A699H9B0_TANCI|nr:phospholipase-like protein [Tanacetum cinerariifolium]